MLVKDIEIIRKTTNIRKVYILIKQILSISPPALAPIICVQIEIMSMISGALDYHDGTNKC